MYWPAYTQILESEPAKMPEWMDMVSDLSTKIRPNFSDQRWAHTIGVIQTACSIVLRHSRFGVSPLQMAQAALFHDIAKDLPSQDLMALIREHGIAIDDLDLGYPAILHGPVGAWMAQTRHGVSDSGVLHAIANHTVGVPQPDAMLRVLMLADSIEPGRNYAGVEEARQLATSDPDAALRLVLQMKLDHVMGKGRTPHPRATAMLDSLRCAAMEVA